MALAGVKPLEQGETYEPAPATASADPISSSPSIPPKMASTGFVGTDPVLANATTKTTDSTAPSPLVGSGTGTGATNANPLGATIKPPALAKTDAGATPPPPPQTDSGGTYTVDANGVKNYARPDLAAPAPSGPPPGTPPPTPTAGFDADGTPLTVNPVTHTYTNAKGEQTDAFGKVSVNAVAKAAPVSSIDYTDPNGKPVDASGNPISANPTADSEISKATNDQFDKLHAEIQALTEKMLNPQDDPVFKQSLNNLVYQYGLSNQAGRDALQMQINSDPSLKGMGAGQAMLAMLSRDQNFSQDQAFMSLSSASQQRMISLQQSGLTQANLLDQQYRAKQETDITAMMQAGDFDGAAALQTKLLNDDGINVTVDPNILRSKDPTTISNYNSQLLQIQSLATSYPVKAKSLAETVMANPLFKGMWPEGMTADDFVNNIVSGNATNALANFNTMDDTLKDIASSAVDNPDVKFTDDTLDLVRKAFTQKGQDINTLGKSLLASNINGAPALDQINSERAANGETQLEMHGGSLFEKGSTTPISIDEYGRIFAEHRFNTYVDAAKNDTPVNKAYNALKANPGFSKYLDETLFPGGTNAVKSWLSMILTNPDAGSIDPSTGFPKPSATGEYPWDDPKNFTIFHNWPMASFDEDGKAADGYYKGGAVYGMPILDPTTHQPVIDPVTGKPKVTQPDQHDLDLDAAYSNYASQNQGANQTLLTPQQWYFASRGGTVGGVNSNGSKQGGDLDPTLIPAEFNPKPVENHLEVTPATVTAGPPGDTGTTGTGTTGTGGVNPLPPPAPSNVKLTGTPPANYTPVYDYNGYDQYNYDQSGYNPSGFDKTGYNKNGFDTKGYDKQGYDKNNLDKNKVINPQATFDQKSAAFVNSVTSSPSNSSGSQLAEDASNMVSTYSDLSKGFAGKPRMQTAEIYGGANADTFGGYQEAVSALVKLGVKDTTNLGWVPSGGYDSGNYKFYGTKDFLDFKMYNDLMRNGLSSDDAMKSVQQLIGDDGVQGIKSVLDFAKYQKAGGRSKWDTWFTTGK